MNGISQILYPCIKLKVVRMSVIIIEGQVLPEKVYGRVLIEWLIEVTEGKGSEKQGGFRKGKGCVDQIFAIKIMVEE